MIEKLKKALQTLQTCLHCEGSGVIFEGVFMHSNPSSYGDYEEVWGDCQNCKGTGKRWGNTKTKLEQIRWIFREPVEEGDIPF